MYNLQSPQIIYLFIIFFYTFIYIFNLFEIKNK